MTYHDVVQEINDWLLRRVEYAQGEGVKPDQIILDPGMGAFINSDPDFSWELLSRLDELVHKLTPFPVLIGASRRGFIGKGAPKNRDPVSALIALDSVTKGTTTSEPITWFLRQLFYV